MIDNDLKGGGWCALPAHTYSLCHTHTHTHTHTTNTTQDTNLIVSVHLTHKTPILFYRDTHTHTHSLTHTHTHTQTHAGDGNGNGEVPFFKITVYAPKLMSLCCALLRTENVSLFYL